MLKKVGKGLFTGKTVYFSGNFLRGVKIATIKLHSLVRKIAHSSAAALASVQS